MTEARRIVEAEMERCQETKAADRMEHSGSEELWYGRPRCMEDDSLPSGESDRADCTLGLDGLGLCTGERLLF